MEKILLISPSTLDRKSLILTLVVCVLPALGFGWLFYRSYPANHASAITYGVVAAIALGIFVWGVIITPYKYILTDAHLIIKRHFKDVVVPLQDIKLIRLMNSDDKKGLYRTFGAEGAFGSWGYFQTSEHKKLTVFARRYNNWTLVVTDRKKYVIAPDDPQLIDAAIQQIGKVKAGEVNSQTEETSSIQWRNWIPAVFTVAVLLFIYSGYREPKVEFDSKNAFKLKGRHGVNIPFDGISKADTIAWREMPAISMRTNGISLFKVKQGKFRTAGGDKIHLSVHCGVSPVIRIVDKRGAVYYINRKNAAETRQIFNQSGIKN